MARSNKYDATQQSPNGAVKQICGIKPALEMPDINRRFTEMGLVPRHSTPEAFGQFLQAEINRWRALLAKKP